MTRLSLALTSDDWLDLWIVIAEKQKTGKATERLGWEEWESLSVLLRKIKEERLVRAQNG